MLSRTLRSVSTRSTQIFLRANSSKPAKTQPNYDETALPETPGLDKVSHFRDPYPLPLDPHTLANEASVKEDHAPLRLPRHNESVQTLKARLVYQSRKRGTLETDLLLSTFAGENLDSMSVEEMKEFDKLMDENDWDIYYWAVGKREAPARWASSSLLAKLKKHAANEGKTVRRMPELS